jgi:ribonuclease HI
METIDPTRQTQLPADTIYKTHTAKTKKNPISEQRNLKDEIQVFTDGSGYNGGIGAAAILVREGQEPRTLRYHLGTDEEHTVYEAETLGLMLAAQLIATEPNIVYPISILLDNQAAIKCGTSTSKEGSGFLAGHFDKMTRQLAKQQRDNGDFDLTLRWIPGHEGVQGNEHADQEAKKAADGQHQNSPNRELPQYLRNGRLLCSAAALKAAHKNKSRAHWKTIWEKSPRYTRTRTIDPLMPSSNFIKLTNGLRRRTSSIYIQFHTHHIPLNYHLHRINKSDTSHCPICPGIDETIHHYLFDCPQYRREHHIFANAVRRNATSITHILTSKKTTPHLIRFINSTGRFKSTFGEL